MSAKLSSAWPVLKNYDQDHLRRIALPLGGIGTGTISLGGIGDLHAFEIMNQPDKKFTPLCFFALNVKDGGGARTTRALEGPVDTSLYEGAMGCTAANHGLPRFSHCSFAAAYPLGQVLLSDLEVPVDVRLEAFNPMIPADADASGIPVAVLRYVLTNKTGKRVTASVCGSLANFVGADKPGDKPVPKKQRNRFMSNRAVSGVVMDSTGGDPEAEQYGSVALTTTAKSGISYRTKWIQAGWSGAILDFWDEFSETGRISNSKSRGTGLPNASLAVEVGIPPRATKAVTFLITWHFPNRYTWTPKEHGKRSPGDCIGNYYTAQYKDALDAAGKTAPALPELERQTVSFVEAFCASELPLEVKEAALFNLANLRSQTCFRTPDGHFYGWEGCHDKGGCCHGSCTHVWNYEQALAFLYGDLAMGMREVEFKHATGGNGLMCFRVGLPLSRSQNMGKAAADGQMGCIIKMYRDWQLSGDSGKLRALWPKVRKAVEFCWIEGGWDGDLDGVMEGCQHNTMDVEYYGPNPQMEIWYLGALRAAEEMAASLGEEEFAETCRTLFRKGSAWIDANLFNGEYYEQRIMVPKRNSDIAEGLRVGMGIGPKGEIAYQLGKGCLVDQLVGQFLAHVCGLGYLVKPANVRKALRAIIKYNLRKSMRGHFNNMRSFALGDEAALLMAHYPGERPEFPFPYFTEVMTGFEYTAAVGMLYEGQLKNGLMCIKNIRDRYDGAKRSPFDEAECGHHYARAMASWAAILALTGFQYSAVGKSLSFAANDGLFFWSTGYAWGTCRVRGGKLEIKVLHGKVEIKKVRLSGKGEAVLSRAVTMSKGARKTFAVK